MTETTGGGHSSDDERLAPVIPLFGGDRSGGSRAPHHRGNRTARTRVAAEEEIQHPPGPRHPARRNTRFRAVSPEPGPAITDDVVAGDADAGVDAPPSIDELHELLVRKLRGKQLSSEEARLALRAAGADEAQIFEIVEEFEERRYLDDASLARHLVTAGAERKGQGRLLIARTLRQRGIPTEIIDEALAEDGGDDRQRALDFARTKARSLARHDEETAMRRLLGQLARRGYSGSIATDAARTALREGGSGGSGVRFVDSE